MPKSAEQRVLSRLGEALPPPYELFANVRWISKPERNSPARDGETDLVIMHPRHGLLIVETTGGRIRRDGQGRWWTNEQPLKIPPFKQAENSKHALRRKIASLPEWSRPLEQLRVGHAVAFPNVATAKIASRERGLGPDAPLALVIDQADLGDTGDRAEGDLARLRLLAGRPTARHSPHGT
jgi:hypothetical protein